MTATSQREHFLCFVFFNYLSIFEITGKNCKQIPRTAILAVRRTYIKISNKSTRLKTFIWTLIRLRGIPLALYDDLYCPSGPGLGGLKRLQGLL